MRGWRIRLSSGPIPADVEDGSVPPPADPGVAASVISAIDETPGQAASGR